MIQSYIGEILLSLVCQEWYHTLDTNDRNIIQACKRRYPSSFSLQEILEKAIEREDIQLFHSIFEFSSILPINWNILAIAGRDTSLSSLLYTRVTDENIRQYLNDYHTLYSLPIQRYYPVYILDKIENASINEDYSSLCLYLGKSYSDEGVKPMIQYDSKRSYPSRDMINILKYHGFTLDEQKDKLTYNQDAIIKYDLLSKYQSNEDDHVLEFIYEKSYRHLHGEILSYTLNKSTRHITNMLLKYQLYPQYIPDLNRVLRTLSSDKKEYILLLAKEYNLVDIVNE